MKKQFIIYPFLFAIYPALFLFSHNIEEVSFSQALITIVIMLVFTLLLLSLLKLIFKNDKKSGIVTFIFLVLFYSYSYVWQIGFIRHMYLLLLWGAIFICGAYFIMRTRRDLKNLTTILNIVAFSLIATSFINIITYEVRTKSNWENNPGKSNEDRKIDFIKQKNMTPFRDIYYIVLDGYANSSILNEIYGYDNSEFTDYLIQRGFYVAFNSRANYPTTAISLPSTLNMEYIHRKIEGKKFVYFLANQMTRQSEVMNFLKSKGYKHILISSGRGPTAYNKYADINLGYRSRFYHSEMDEFLMLFAERTILLPFIGKFLANERFTKHNRERVLFTFSELSNIHKIRGPKFIFAHIISPHPPYVFGKNGEMVAKTDFALHGDIWRAKEPYVNQLIFLNKKIKNFIEETLLKSEVQPIIILQSDHGTQLSFYSNDRSDEAFIKPNLTNLRERMRNFNALYLPQGGDSYLYDSITNVNTFRVILNHYFGENYELLKDKCYYYNKREQPYKFFDVTNFTLPD